MALNLEKYFPYVKRLAWKWYNKAGGARNASLSIDDLFHDGLEALCRCRDRFESTKCGNFWGYACFNVEGAIIDSLGKSSLVHIPKGKRKRLVDLEKAYIYLAQKLNRDPQIDELADFLEISVEDIHGLKTLRPVSEEIKTDAPDSDTPLDGYMRAKLVKDFGECRDNLDSKEKLILEARIKGVVFKKLSRSFKVSVETIRRWQNKTIEKMKSCLESKDWSVEDAPFAHDIDPLQ